MSNDWSLEDLGPEALARLRRMMSNPLSFAQNLVINYETQEKFVPNYPQTQIMGSDKLVNWICVHRRAGKALPLTNQVYTPTGPTLMGMLQIGMVVLTPSGGRAHVTEIIPQGQQVIYRLLLDDGTHVDSCEHHLWEVWMKSGWKGPRKAHRQQYKSQTLSTGEIHKTLTYKYSNREEYNYKLNPIQPLDYEHCSLPIDPYLLGVLLGDGCLKTLEITSADSEIVDRITSRTGLSFTVRPAGTSAASRYFLSRAANSPGARIYTELQTLKLVETKSKTKFIPSQYLFAHTEARLELLRGLMDTDGSSDQRRRGQAEFCTTSPQLAQDLAELCRSLGCKVRVKQSVASYTKNGVRKETGIRFRLGITVPEGLEIFSLSRKQCGGLPVQYLRRTIVGVEVLESCPMQCINIDDPQHLFVTDNCTPTHNCLTGDTLIIPSDSLRPTPLALAQGTDRTLTFDFQTNSIVWSACHWIRSGEKPCLRLQLGTGVSVSLSTDHLLYVHNKGWLQAQEIKVGDRILAPSEIPIFGDLTDAEVDIRELVETTISNSRVPDPVFLLNKSTLQQYVKLLWETQGRSIPTFDCLCIMVYNRSLALDLHHLLLRFGVESRVSEDQNVFIDDHLDQCAFLNLVGVPYPQYDVRAPRRWEVVINIRKIGVQEVYDLQVEHPDHNFLANDVVVHNSHALSLLALYYAITQENKRIIYFTPSAPQLEEIFNEKISGWISANPLISQEIDERGINRNTPNPVRSFKTGSSIQGFILGTKEGAQEGKRGLTADILFLDEAQEYSTSDWAVVGAIMGGDSARRERGGVLTYVAGTIRQPDGHFFKKIKKYDLDSRTENRIFIPVTENKSETPESIAKLKISQPPEIWNNEWLLELGDEEDTVFPKDDVTAASILNWSYGSDKIGWSPLRGQSDDYVRFIGVDWDRVGAGTNIAVVQYDPMTRHMWTIDRLEVERGDFTYMNACEQIFQLYDTYHPLLVVSDAGAGEMQWQYLYLESAKRGYPDLQHRLIKLSLGSKIEMFDPQTQDISKMYIKPVLVGLLQKKLQERQWFFPGIDEELKMQLLTYKKVRETVNTVTFTSRNEHVIDCHMFAIYGIWQMYENPLRDDPDAALAFRNLGVEKLSFQSEDQVQSFWRGVEGERNPVMGQRSNIFGSHPMFGGQLTERSGYEESLESRLGGRSQDLGRWLLD